MPTERARWVFASHLGSDLKAKLDLGDGRTLYVGDNARRVLAKGDDLEDAPFLGFDDLSGVLRDDKGGFAFVTRNADVYLTSEPLGPLGSPRPGPRAAQPSKEQPVTCVATGRAAVIAVLSDGQVRRTVDFGQTWKPVDYAGSDKPFGRPACVALDSKGNGVLVHLPQRLFVTHDDGATWAPIASPAIGSRWVVRDGHDRVFVHGYHDSYAMLEGQTLVATRTGPAEIFGDPGAWNFAHRFEVRTTVLVGDHVVELKQDTNTRTVKVTSTKLGERPGPARPAPDLSGDTSTKMDAAAHGKTLLYLRRDGDAGTSLLLTSDDFGATWHKGETFQGVVAAHESDMSLAAGPRGWAFVSSLCSHEPRDLADELDSCAPLHVRPAGATAFQDVVSTEEFDLAAVAFDEAHDRVYVIGKHDGRKHVYASPLTGNKFARTDILDTSDGSRAAITVDPNGVLRVMEYDGRKGVWVLHRSGPDGHAQPPLYVPFEDGINGEIALAGARGLFLNQQHGYETADGGETWMRVATNNSGRLQCTGAGCVADDVQRAGWDIPAVQDQPKLAAQAELQRPTNVGTPITPASVNLVCKPAGAAARAPESIEFFDRGGNIRWASGERNADGRVSVVVADRARVQVIELLGAESKPRAGLQVRTDLKWLHEGLVAARYTFAATRGAHNPIDVELAWWSASTGRVVHKSLPKVKPFDVSFGERFWIVTGGLLFQSEPQEPLYFARDDGKIERLTIPIPPNTGIEEVERVGNRWLTMNSDVGGVRFAWSDDGAKSWKQGAWGLGVQGGSGLAQLAGKPVITWNGNDGRTLAFVVGANPPNEPPTPLVVEDSLQSPSCGVTDTDLPRRLSVPHAQALHARITGADQSETELTADTLIQRATSTGTACTGAYLFLLSTRGVAESAFLYPEAKGWTGWRFSRVDAQGKPSYSAQPLTCQPSK